LPKAPDAPAPLGTIEIPPPSCAVVASASVEAGAAPLDVQFSGEGMCTDADGTVTWNFGDGSAPSQEQNPTHTYPNPGTYTARVSIADPEHNARDEDEVSITVTAP
jgi:PKD repeat protein